MKPEAELSADSETEAYPCRMVTPAEIAHYREFGWVQLRAFVDPDMLAHLLRKAQGIMGEDGDSNPPYEIDQPYFNAQAAGGLADRQMRWLIEKIGCNAKALMARKADTRVRYFTDFFAPKLPAEKKTRNMGNGATSFHQDFITFAVDRTGGMTFWIPLEAYGTVAGTMSFLTGSHRLGVLGNYTSYGGRDIRDVFPELRDCEETPQIDYALGDVTVHSHLTVHGAGKNMLDRPRWAYLVLPQPADAVWNGAPPEAFDPTGMTPYAPFDDARFPIIAE